MRIRRHRLYRDERGMTYVFVGIGFLAFMSASTLAVDIGMFLTARTQAQNAADAGALAGATALVFNDYNDRSASGPAVQNAISTAQANGMMGAVPSVLSGDVTFPVSPSGEPNRVSVTVQRSLARGDAIPTLVGPLLGMPTVDIRATATAEASPAASLTCVKPFMIPDKWSEKQTAPWDPGDDFNMYDSHNNPIANPDVYVPATDRANYTGYTVANDKGRELVLRAGTGDEINPSFYYSWKMPGDTGGDFYRENIYDCNQSIINWGQTIIQEPGNMVGPTIQGIEMLIAKDPAAEWDTSCKCVKHSAFAVSPRVFPIPLYDPLFYSTGKSNGRPADFKVANFLGFFADHVSGNRIYGRITTIVSTVSTTVSPPAGAFPVVIRLVQ